MAELEDLLAVATADTVARKQRKHPDGWEPGVDTAKGTVTVQAGTEPQDWSHVLEQFQLDPQAWEVVSDRVHVRTWDGPSGERLFYYRADVRPRTAATQQADVDALCRRIASHKYRRPSVEKNADLATALVVCLADWQAGPDPQGLVDLVLAMKNKVVDRLKTEQPDVLYVVGMGDMVEGCDGHYAMETFATGAGGMNGYRDQAKLVRRLLVDLLTTWARHVPKMVVGAVPGNHGERRKDGKAFTTFEDNADLEVFEQAGEILAANPDAYGHVRFVLPDGDMSLTLDVAGTVVSFIHGHQARGGTPRQRIEKWWRGKQSARHPVGDADVLVSAHLHHFVAVEDGPRTWFQCPAMAHSRWFEESGGPPTKTGTLTFMAGPDGWDGLRVLR